MVSVFAIVFASAICGYPGLAQSSGGYSSGSTRSSANASAYTSVFSYATNSNGVRGCTHDRCTPTCSLPSPQNCPPNSNPCNCSPGTIISEKGGQCVQEQQCQKYINCKGDYNASYTDCPNACPSTCARPNAQYCNPQCAPPGCECNSGYLLSSLNGKCIKPEDCPGGEVCRKNEVFVGCLVECPDLYCPVDESRVACGVARPCPSACACKYNYLRKSVDDHTCILASECPPGKCSRPNEEWNRCVSPCFSDSCEELDKLSTPKECPFSPAECYPRCLCKKGFYRNDSNVCIPVQECQTSRCNEHNNATYRNCPITSPSTCAKPNAHTSITRCTGTPKCECNPGYLLTEINGTCIQPEDCPGGNVCGRNERFTSCAHECPDSYCPKDDGPRNACRPPQPCPSGCRCERNYLRKSNKEHICILASECPPVTCTRPNEEWSGCQIPCFSDYCSDRNKPKPEFCPATERICIPRCICKVGFYRNRDSICIPSEECPPSQ